MTVLFKLFWINVVLFSRIIKGLFGVLCLMMFVGGYTSMQMPGASFQGEIPPANTTEKDIAIDLKYDVQMLANRIGERNTARISGLTAAAKFIENSLEIQGYRIQRQEYWIDGHLCHNIEVEIRGSQLPNDVIIIGSHYDSARGANGADDNATGVAATLSLARYFAGRRPLRSIRFVFFVNSESPYAQTTKMGSHIYAKRSAVREENVVAMFNLESLGIYDDAADSQQFPVPLSLFYPSTGNFVGFIANPGSARLMQNVLTSFREAVQFPTQGIYVPADGLRGAGHSDHSAFWEAGFPAIWITDTGALRNPNHQDWKERTGNLDFPAMARLVNGLRTVVWDLAARK